MNVTKRHLLWCGLVLLFTSSAQLIHAHPGRTNSEGCHNNRRTGDYHCHNGGGRGRKSKPKTRENTPAHTYEKPDSKPTTPAKNTKPSSSTLSTGSIEKPTPKEEPKPTTPKASNTKAEPSKIKRKSKATPKTKRKKNKRETKKRRTPKRGKSTDPTDDPLAVALTACCCLWPFFIAGLCVGVWFWMTRRRKNKEYHR